MNMLVDLLKHLISKTRYLAPVFTLLGISLLGIGVRNINQLYQLLDSPLDQSSPVEEGEYPFSLDAPPSAAGDDFIPIYAASDPEDFEAAPEIEISVPIAQNQSVLESIPVLIPERLVINSIGVDSTIVPVDFREVEYLGKNYQQWNAPRNQQLGWHSTSALLGTPGNTVINGHSSGYGESFRDLDQLKNGDTIDVYAEDYHYTYVVANTLVLKERWESIDVRMQNASWINSSTDERLTLISCWPNDSSTHRLIIVAVPLQAERIQVSDSGDPDGSGL